mmetsp:Transcript_25460/g.47448  ORF Transcript_25460/g.47448 Transcript_25460/m.47448 type:complete len:872 (-) Transcript_25460:2332-4947(-)
MSLVATDQQTIASSFTGVNSSVNMSILERVRASGKYPPSLLGEYNGNEDGFEAAMMKVLDANDLCLSSGPSLAEDFKNVLQMASSLDSVPGDDPEKKKAILISRRCIILALVGATPTSNSSLDVILQNGYLSTVKQWMDAILNGSVGGVDLLLHLLTNIAQLPVTKTVVKESGMGKAIGSVEKNKICAGTPNEEPIKERVSTIKDAWHKSVKVRKEKTPEPASSDSNPSVNSSNETKASVKRELDSSSSQTAQPITKKAKVEDSKKSSVSSLLQKMAPSSKAISTNGAASKKASAQKKQKKRVKWKDHFGGNLSASKILEDGDSVEVQEPVDESSVSWSDRRKRDRLREKELLAKAKKAKLSDDDDMGVEASPAKAIQPTIAWHVPPLLPERTDAPPPPVNSSEKVAQTTRMASVAATRYSSEHSVPSNPTPLSDVEQALDMTSQSSTVTQSIPFFVPQAPSPAPVVPAPSPQLAATSGTAGYPVPPLQPASGVASVEVVQSLGLPLFLAGQNVEALKTLASTPSLLNTFVDSNGMYDQVRLMNLVQTLSQNSAPAGGQAQPPATPGFPHQSPTAFGTSTGTYGSTSGGIYGPASGSQSAYGDTYGGGGMKNGYRGAQNSGEGNLHLSGYGPSTTQSEIIALFSPYVQVDEVVMKATFSFVNTNDPVGAKRAREALNGALLGGQPVRINMAQRKNRDAAPNSDAFSKAPTPTDSYYGNQNRAGSAAAVAAAGFSGGASFGQSSAPPVPGQALGQGSMADVSHIRDDRGNPATKNLFVAGYGQGTSEQLLRQVFSPHCQIVSIVMKGTFSFLNTAEKRQAVHAREVLSGTMLNGGVLRINFAKETGRLGTSFDLTYGNSSQSQSRSHYGPRY